MDPLFWAVILLVAGLLLSVMEFFVPSGGVIGFLALACLLGSISLAFSIDRWTGLGFMTAVVVLAPTVVALGLKWWPDTPLGRRVLLRAPKPEEEVPDSPLRRELKQLLGKVGTAKSLMMPSGPVVVDGVTIDAMSEGMAIEAGQRVRIVAVHGMAVVVRPTTDEPTPAARDPNDPLAKSIESVGLDPFSDPLK